MLAFHPMEVSPLAVAAIAHKPDLTSEQAQAIFRRRFEPQYRIEGPKGLRAIGPRRDFVVVKNAFTAVSVKLQQDRDETKFVYTGLAPRLWARVLSGLGLLTVVMSFFVWNGLTNEVKQFIEQAPEFK